QRDPWPDRRGRARHRATRRQAWALRGLGETSRDAWPLFSGAGDGAASRWQRLAGPLRHVLELARQSEPHVFLDDANLANVRGTPSADLVHDLGHQEFRRRGPGRDADTMRALEPLGPHVGLVVDEV